MKVSYTVKEVAQALKLSPLTIYRMVGDGRLKALKIGKAIRFIPPSTIGDPRTDYKIRAIVARVGLTANTPEEAVYLDGMLDADGNRLTGANRYTMTFKQLPPFHEPAFWALRMFDAKNSCPVPNPLNRYVLGSD